MNKEEAENNRIPKEIAKALGTKKEDKDSLITFKENLYERTARENVRLKKELEQKESILDKATEFVTKIATENAEKYNSKNQKEVDFSEWNLALEILNIIEGEKK